ncbi:hypothetical protein CEXT_436641 [Caerostris extrusa]|uniref:Uncharacterized protein n=1 Tax=Caerostris extrusa TaxID=172846 RepID=A0AAV4WL78_CAEEX|nr:hypothetical protein CEXT_436641 [Caerostris extrusa]
MFFRDHCRNSFEGHLLNKQPWITQWVNTTPNAFFCAALVAVSASGLIAAPLVNTGVSATSSTQDAYGNYAYRYDIQDAATGSINSKAEVGKVGAVAVAAPAVAYGAYATPAVAAYAAPAVAAYAAPAVASTPPPQLWLPVLLTEVFAAQVLAGRAAYGGYSAPWPTEVFSDTEAALGLGYGAVAFTVLDSKGHPLSDARPEMDVFYGYE